MARKLTPKYLEMLIDSARAVVKVCLELGLECRDPPISSTSLLYSLGYTQYMVRSLWSRLPRDGMRAIIYKYEKAKFFVELEHAIETLYTLEYNGLNVPIDDLDAERLKRKHCQCKISPRTHSVRVYVKGFLSEHVSISINAMRVLVLLGESMGIGIVDDILDSLNEVIWNYNLQPLEKNVARFFREHKYAHLLSLILPYVPRDSDDLLRVSPILRNLTVLSRRRRF